MQLMPETNAANADDVKEAIATLMAQGHAPSQILLGALEGTNVEAAYWTIKVLGEVYFANLCAPVGHFDNNPDNPPILPVHAAILLNNTGAFAALMEQEAFEGVLDGESFGLIMRMVPRAQSELMGVLVRFLEAKGELARLIADAPLPTEVQALLH